jgi:regulation of enolase protein 1 (concanavalin A-like superfamily)
MLVTSNWGNANTTFAKVNADGTLTGLGYMGNQPSPPAQDSRGFAWSAISPDGVYALQGTNIWGNTQNPSGANLSSSAPHGNGSGLTGDYYANTTASGPSALEVTDTTVDFNWGATSPGAGITAGSSYSVKWTGYVQAIYSETYTFETESSDGVQLTVGGQLLIDHLGAQGDTKYTGTIMMTAGAKVPVTLVYQNLSNTSQVHLRWSSASQPYEVIRETQLYPSAAAVTNGLNGFYFNGVANGLTFDPTMSTPTASRLDANVNFGWNGAAPITGVAGTNFGAEWTGSVLTPCTGTYNFCVAGDDGVRLYIDGTLVANGWAYQGTTQYCSAGIAETAGTKHTLRMDYFQGGGGATAYLQWKSTCLSATATVIPSGDLFPTTIPPTPTNGLTATYYNAKNFTGTATTQIDPTVNFSWNGSSPAANVSGTNFSAEWTGQVQIPCTDTYQFCAVGDDGVRLWIDGALVADGWKDQGATSYCNSVGSLTAGTKHDVKMDYYQGNGGAVAQLEWSAACVGVGAQVIPQADLFPTGDSGTGGYDMPFHTAGDLGTGVGYSILQLSQTVGSSPTDVTGPNSWGLGTTAMMVPTFSPDGSRLVFVDGDTSGGASWRNGLSYFLFDEAAKAFSKRTTFVNTKASGDVLRWPTVESDSRSVIYQTNPKNQDDWGYGGMGPSGYSSIPGKLMSVDMDNPTTPVALTQINTGLGGIDANQSYQATVLPTAAGGYRWTVFTSDRQYGNLLNVPGGATSTTQLWVGALDDAVSAATDRSHPPFWLPNQVLDNGGGRIRNERAYWVLDQCRPSLANLNPPASMAAPMFNFSDMDIGNVAHAGAASANAGVISVTGGGDDIWNMADAFNYAYVPISGDFQFVAHVTNVSYADYWTKAGIMLRDNLAPNAAYAHMMINAGEFLGFQWRLANGNNCDWTAGGPSSFPQWLRLTRKGTLVTGEVSDDGTTWTTVGTITPSIGTNAYIGLAVTAHNNATTATATFDNVGFVAPSGIDPRPASECLDNQDCCDAQSTPPTAACQVDTPIDPNNVKRHCLLVTGNSCVALGSRCVSDTDCCGFPTNHCNVMGVCAVPPPPFPYADTVFTRDFTASCPSGTNPIWRAFNWDASFPPGSDADIKFSVGTAGTAAMLPATIGDLGVVPLVTVRAINMSSTMAGPTFIFDVLKAAGQSPNLNYLRLFADFQPSTDGNTVPTLADWQVAYDCVAAE